MSSIATRYERSVGNDIHAQRPRLRDEDRFLRKPALGGRGGHIVKPDQHRVVVRIDDDLRQTAEDAKKQLVLAQKAFRKAKAKHKKRLKKRYGKAASAARIANARLTSLTVRVSSEQPGAMSIAAPKPAIAGQRADRFKRSRNLPVIRMLRSGARRTGGTSYFNRSRTVRSTSSGFSWRTRQPGGTLSVTKTEPAITLSSPMTVSPPRITAPA